MKFRSFLFCLSILIWRCWDRILNPGIWAEEGRVFWAEASEFGIGSILIPHEGYFHVFGRFAMWFLDLSFPTIWMPTLVTVSGIILYAAVMCTFADKAYRYLVSSDLNRIFIAAGLCLIPGTKEILGNICNNHRILAVYVLFMGLRPITNSIPFSNVFFVAIIAGSAGEVVAFLPLFFYRSLQRFKLTQKAAEIRNDLLIISVIFSWSCLNFFFRHTNSESLGIDLFEVARVTFAGYLFGFATQPIVGWRMTENLYRFVPILYWVLATASSFFLLRNFWKGLRSKQCQLYLGILAICAIQLLAWIVRPSNMEMYEKMLPGMWWGGERLAFYLAFAGFFIWANIFGNKSGFKGIAFVLIYFILSNSQDVPRYGDVSYWPSAAQKIQQIKDTGCPKEVSVPIFPKDWEMTYKSKRTDCVE